MQLKDLILADYGKKKQVRVAVSIIAHAVRMGRGQRGRGSAQGLDPGGLWQEEQVRVAVCIIAHAARVRVQDEEKEGGVLGKDDEVQIKCLILAECSK